MCGILIFAKAGNEALPSFIDSARTGLASLAHRGPDAQRELILDSGRTFLGHSRLAIIAVDEKGAQPRTSKSGNCTIVFNGEIYNYRELASSHGLSTEVVEEGDTSVLIELLDKEGVSILGKLEGMFAFILVDHISNRLLLVRDRFGIKPLYYAFRNGALVAASEVRTIGKVFPIEIRDDAISSFLLHGSVPEPATAFDGVFAVPTGSLLAAQRDPSEDTGWKQTVETWAPTHHVDANSSLQNLRDTLIESVRLHFVSDVPVAILLSGGIDSTLLAFIAREILQLDTLSLTVGSSDPALNESDLAVAASRRFGINSHIEYKCPSDPTILVSEFLQAVDQPTVDGMNTFLAAQAARRSHIKVLISGLGGDEVLGGYPSFKTIPFLAHAHRLAGTSLLQSLAFKKVTEMACGALKLNAGKVNQLLSTGPRLASIYEVYRGLFRPDQLKIPRDSHGSSQSQEREADSMHLAIAKLEIERYLRNQLLRDVDVFSMAHGVETRVPYLGTGFTNAALSLLQGSSLGTPKRRLVSGAFGDFPEEFLMRPKRGFTVPMDSWLRTPGILSVLNNESLMEPVYAYMDRGVVRSTASEFMARKAHWSRPWAILVLQSFLSRYPRG